MGRFVVANWLVRLGWLQRSRSRPRSLNTARALTGAHPALACVPSPSQEEYDVIVIGGGSGGSGFSRRAAGYGQKVVIIDRGVMWDSDGNRLGAGIGGTCVNVSCCPLSRVPIQGSSSFSFFLPPSLPTPFSHCIRSLPICECPLSDCVLCPVFPDPLIICPAPSPHFLRLST